MSIVIADVAYPPETDDPRHDEELEVAISEIGERLSPAEALAFACGYGVGIDLTRRDLQDVAKAARRPWDLAKGLDESAPLSELAPAVTPHPVRSCSTSTVGGTATSPTRHWNTPELLSVLSHNVALRPADLAFTGTPAGVGPLRRSEVVSARIACVADLMCRIL